MPKPPTPPVFDPQAPDPRARRRRWLPWAGGGFLALVIILGLWPRAIPAEIEDIARGDLRVTIEEEGQTRVRNRHVVSSPAAGQLRRVVLRPGDPVKAGETVLAELESAAADVLDTRSLAQAEARVSAAQSALAAAEARRESAASSGGLARAELERLRALAAGNLISAQELDTSEARAVVAAQDERAAMFSAQVAGFELEQARATLAPDPADPSQAGLRRLIAPVDGRVLRVFQESARLVAGGTPLLEIGDLSDLEVRVEVLSRDGVAVSEGASVSLERWGGEGVLNARVRRVEPAAFTKISALGVEEQRVNLIADFTDPLERRAALGDGFRVDARIVVWSAKDVLLAPSGALFQRDGEWRVFVVERGKARLRVVVPGRSDGLRTQVVSGLEPGEQVIVYPGDRVFAGTRVRRLPTGR